jgi:hypothetical protein
MTTVAEEEDRGRVPEAMDLLGTLDRADLVTIARGMIAVRPGNGEVKRDG